VFTRIRWRIAASYVALVALVLLGLGIYLVSFLRAQQLSALEDQLQRQARLVAQAVGPRLATEDRSSLDPVAKELGRELGVRVTFIAPDGTVLGDSDHDPATMENHATRPEVAQALRTGSGQSQRHSATLDRDLLYVAVPIDREGTPLGVARVAVPVSDVQAALDRVTVAVATAFIIAALLAIALATAVARVTTDPIQAVTLAARRLASGELDQVISVAGRDEVSLLASVFNEMAATLRSQIAAMNDQRERLAAVLGHMADGLVIVGGDGTVRLINPAAATLLQVAPEQAVGRAITSVTRHPELTALVSAALAGDGAAAEARLVELGQQRAVQAVASRIPGGDEADPQVLLVLHDVTELRRTETVRREFVANVSHELRTPVASLKALVETLEDGALADPEAAREFIGRMHVEVDGLAQLVEELLELSRIESGRVALRLRPADLASVVQTATERLRPLAERQGVKLVLQPPDTLPPVSVDPERIQQVVANLVHNAVKFTPPGGTISVGVQQRGRDAAVVVADSGIGIPPELLDRLFERFYKADKARASGGTGLGLAIAKHLVQAHGGRIWAESAGEGRGATFIFTLPPLPTTANA